MMNTSIMDHSFCPIVSIDEQQNMVYFNPMFATFIGKSPRVLKKSPNVIEHFNANAEVLSGLIKSAFTTKEIQIGPEMSTDTTKGGKSFVLKLIPFEGNLFLIFNDVTVERGLYEKYREKLEELRQGHQQIVHADRLRAIGELTSSMAHEVNNPLTVAIGNAELIGFSLESKKLESERENIQNAQRNLTESLLRIERIIQGMRQFAHKGETNKEYASLQETVKSALAMVGPSFEKANIQVKLNLQQTPILGIIDRLKIEQVLVNIFSNARDALSSKSDGKIEVHLTQDFEQGMNIFAISDNGSGIPLEFKDSIYQAFFSTKSPGEGTGLGLSIAKRLIDAHLGSLTHTSSNSGTTFHIALPMIELSSFADSALGYDNDLEKIDHKILIIDNEVSILNLIKNYVKDSSYRIIGSTGGKNAIQLLKDVIPSMIITDLSMPEINGRELAQEVRKNAPSIPIAYMSSVDNQRQFIEDKDKLNLCGFLKKPFSKDELLEFLKSKLGT